MGKTSSTLVWSDLLLIAGLVVLSRALYVGQLGFYSDDWIIISYFRDSGDQSLGEILRRAVIFEPYRPGQAANLGVLYWLFGLNPLGYHLVNTLVFASMGGVFYAVLRELAQPRLVALAIPAVFLSLPHYSTDHFWYAAFAVAVAAVFYLLSLYADLRVVRPGRWPWGVWKCLGLAGLLASVLTYEIFLPLFFLSPLLVWYRSHRPGIPVTLAPGGLSLVKALGLGVPTVVAIFAAMAYKMATATRFYSKTLEERFSWFGNLLKDAVETTVTGDFGAGLPATLGEIGRYYLDPWSAVLALLCGLLVWVALLRSQPAESNALRPGPMLGLVACGVLLFFSGYAVFFASFNAAVSATGMNNRTALLSTAGLACLLVGVVGWLCSFFPRGRRLVFSGTLALLCGTGVLILNTLASFWIVASVRQQQVLTSLKTRLPMPPVPFTLLLDGVCPYIGPAPVFETWWDLSGALRILYQNPQLKADVVTNKMRVGEEGVYSRMYGELLGPYLYPGLLVFHYGRQAFEELPGPFAAQRYFASPTSLAQGGCPPSSEGEGEPLFQKGAAPVSRALLP